MDITDLRDNQIEELKKFHKSYFDVDNILNSASELKYMGELKAIIQEEFSSPSTDFVKMFATKVYEGRMLQNIIDQFTPLVKRAISSHINDIINDRLKGALTVSDSKVEEKPNQKQRKYIRRSYRRSKYRIQGYHYRRRIRCIQNCKSYL